MYEFTSHSAAHDVLSDSGPVHNVGDVRLGTLLLWVFAVWLTSYSQDTARTFLANSFRGRRYRGPELELDRSAWRSVCGLCLPWSSTDAVSKCRVARCSSAVSSSCFISKALMLATAPTYVGGKQRLTVTKRSAQE